MSQPAPTPAHGAETRPPVEYTQEIRFAVVMYGGSSLAIYMNGVAQELLRLVRATAPAPGGKLAHLPAEGLEGSTHVYRKLGQILARGEEPRPAAGVKDGDPLQTRFVIDILTGTSAGGINAVYLAKALVNDQSLDELKGLWVTEGDIGVLLNDPKSDERLGLGGQKPPRSLLNGRRMYLKLLQALRGMDNPKSQGGKKDEVVKKKNEQEEEEKKSPYVDELDLFVTATDMLGRVIPLRLADGVACERRHRNVFRFRYFTKEVGGEYRNDFQAAYNPFLAFAARCTSAHQAAFEVMRLGDIKRAVEKFPPAGGAQEHPIGSAELKKFYKEYLPPAGGPGLPAAHACSGKWVPFEERSFSDGGVLDNSPFSFASDALPFRHADAPVDRKLIYIEPSPEHPEEEEESADRPDFFRNALMALTTLPRYQTIVEDLVRVLERNRLIERVNHIILGLEGDLKWKRTRRKGGDQRGAEPPRLEELLKSPEKTLEWIEGKRENISWGGYQRLRVAEVTDDLTLLVARAAGFDEESDEFTAIRYLVRQWREDNYYDADVAGDKQPQVAFLLHFDLMWIVRRLKLVLTKINEISCFDERAWQVLEAARHEGEPQLWEKDGKPDKASRAEMREALLSLKREVSAAFTGLRVERRRLWSRDEDNIFRPYIAALGIGSEDLLELLKRPNDKARREYANKDLLSAPLNEATRARLDAIWQELLDEKDRAAMYKQLGERRGTRMEAVAALTKEVEVRLRAVIDKARHGCEAALNPRPPEGTVGDVSAEAFGARGGTESETVLRKTLWHYYRHFDDYDQVAYPILHATNVGDELDPIEVFRISPEDATFLVNEKKEGVRKLAGTTLGHFGAFFERKFRVNDIMWGRLDAAERLIRALLPNAAHEAMRDELTKEAHRAIIIEEMIETHLKPKDKEELNRLVRETLAEAGGVGGESLAAQLAAALKGTGINPSLKSFLGAFLEKVDPIDKFRQDFKDNYEAERAFTPHDTVVNAGRASRIFGRMVDGIAAERRRGGNKLILWLVRLTRWVWGLAEVAVPGTIPNLFALHLLRVVYFFEVALVALGVLFAWKEAQRFGLVALALTGALHVLLLFIGDYVRGGPAGERKFWRWFRLAWRTAVVVALIGALIFLLYYANSKWLPWLLDSFIGLLQGLRRGL